MQDIASAIVEGNMALRCMQSHPLHVLTMAVLPIYVIVMFAYEQQEQAIGQLKQLYQPETEETTSNEFLSLCWYYYICIELILSAGMMKEYVYSFTFRWIKHIVKKLKGSLL